MTFDPHVCTLCDKMLIYGHRSEPRSVEEQRSEEKYWWCYGCRKDLSELENEGKIEPLFSLEEEQIEDIVGDSMMLDVLIRKHKNEV